MGLIGWAIALVVVAIICRVLRATFKAVDSIAYICVLAAFIIVWITDGFWMGLLAGVIGCVVVSLLFGIGGGTEFRQFGRKWTIICAKCGYDHLEITEYTYEGVVARCKRCGHICHYTRKHK